MYNIFFHIAGIAFIEIMFYFYYIGPIETNIFKNSVKKIVAPLKNQENNLEPIIIVSPYNTSQFILLEDNEENNITRALKDNVDKANKTRDRENHELFIWTIQCWSILIGFCILLMIIQERHHIIKLCNQRKIKKTVSISDMDIEMIQRASLQPINNNDSTDVNIDIDNSLIDNFDNENQIVSEEENKDSCTEIKHNIIHYTILSVGILGFEYLFFKFVIMKYHVISTEELEYLLYLMTIPMLHKYIEIYD